MLLVWRKASFLAGGSGLAVVAAPVVALAEELGVSRLAAREARPFAAVRLGGGRRGSRGAASMR